jgi:hypothetical protein
MDSFFFVRSRVASTLWTATLRQANACARTRVPQHPLHSVERQRGREDDLQKHLTFFGIAGRDESEGDAAMRKLLLGLLSLGAVTIAVPAQSQVYLDAGPGGVGVRIGGPPYGRYYDDDWRGRHRRWGDGYAYESCRVVRERVETPSGRVIIRTRREC